MKKASLANLSVIIGLLILCVVVLLAVYATSPESVMLLEESFNFLDSTKWKHEMSECTEDAEKFHYVSADEKNRLTADGILHISPNLTNIEFRNKRNAPNKCYSCIVSENSTSDCIPSLFSAKLQSKTPLNASRGRMEIRAKLCCGDRVRFHIGMISNENNSMSNDTIKNLDLSEEGSINGSSEVNIMFDLVGNTTVIKSPIYDNEFHVYEINWDNEKISLNVDGKRVKEEKFELVDSQEEYFSNTTGKFDSTPISKPFYLLLGVNFGEEFLGNSENHSYYKRSVDEVPTEAEDANGLEVDYVRVFEILN